MAVLEEGFAIGDWNVLPHANTLEFCNGQLNGRSDPLRINSKSMQVLVCLASKAGKFVSKDELFAAVWADRIVTEDVLTGAVRTLRRTMGDDARNPHVIETRKGSGYRLIAPVHVLSRPFSAYRQPVLRCGAALLAVGFIVGITSWLVIKAPREEPTVAVLPFVNLTNDERNTYVASALTDGLILDLAQHDRLQVISRTSVLPYADQQKSLPEIAAELGADYLVEGSVLTNATDLRISAQLIDASDDTHVWASSYDRRVDDILVIQSEVADKIAGHIVGAVAVAPDYTARRLSGEALDTWLKARYWLAQETPALAERALVIFENLARQYPEHAEAHLGKAQAQLLLFKQFRLRPEALADALDSIERAIAIDPTRSEAYRCYGQIVLFKDWDFVSSENAYRHAIDLNPSDTVARRRYAWLLVALRRYDDALEQIAEAKLLDPHYYASADGALLLLFSGQQTEAVAELERLNAAAPGSARTLRILAVAYWGQGRYDESTAALIEGRQAEGDSKQALQAALDTEGRSGVYRYLLSPGVTPAPVSKAALYAQLGDYESTLEWLEQAVSVRDPAVVYLDTRPEFVPLQDDPRFQALVRRVKPAH